MKPTTIKIFTGFRDEKLESRLASRHERNMEKASQKGAFFAQSNRPLAGEENLDPYIGEILAEHASIGAEIHAHFQPSSEILEAKIDASYFKEKTELLKGKLLALKTEIDFLKNKLVAFSLSHLPLLVIAVIASTTILMFAEVALNSQAFQLLGESLLLTYLISFTISFALILFAHFTANKFKEARSQFRRNLIFFGSLILVSIVFFGIAQIRSQYLEGEGIHINPVYFLLFNDFIFLVTFLLTYYALPPWSHIQEEFARHKAYYRLRSKERKKRKLEQDLEKLALQIAENSTEKVFKVDYVNYLLDITRKRCNECIEAFKGSNMTYRMEQVPVCFFHPNPTPNIEDFTYTLKTKQA